MKKIKLLLIPILTLMPIISYAHTMLDQGIMATMIHSLTELHHLLPILGILGLGVVIVSLFRVFQRFLGK
jgi:hypothetical protein